jgi:hypothetical protein
MAQHIPDYSAGQPVTRHEQQLTFELTRSTQRNCTTLGQTSEKDLHFFKSCERAYHAASRKSKCASPKMALSPLHSRRDRVKLVNIEAKEKTWLVNYRSRPHLK